MFYLIEHNRSTKDTTYKLFSDYGAAQRECFVKEQDYFLANRGEMEVVVFEADSLEDLKRTHSRYFVKAQKESDAKNALLAVGLVGLALYLLK